METHISMAMSQALAGSNTGVFVGCIWLEYGGLLAQHGASGGAFPVTGNGLAFLAGRMSYTFGFAGPCIPTNTGTQSCQGLTTYLESPHPEGTKPLFVAPIPLIPSSGLLEGILSIIPGKSLCTLVTDRQLTRC